MERLELALHGATRSDARWNGERLQVSEKIYNSTPMDLQVGSSGRESRSFKGRKFHDLSVLQKVAESSDTSPFPLAHALALRAT